MTCGSAQSASLSDASRPVAVFDSGLGGLTVVRKIIEGLPGEDIIYLGDSARVPYGIKSPETVREFALQDAGYLMQFDPKLLVVACNTASAVAIDALSESVAAPVVGVVRPAAMRAAELAAGGIIAVIGTEGTIRSQAYAKALADFDVAGEVLSAAAPLLVPIVEEGRRQDDPVVLAVLTDYLHELQRRRPAVLILGCTHYPLLSRAIGKLMGPQTQLLDPGAATAGAVKETLTQMNAINPQSMGTLRCLSTDNPERFARLARRFLGRDPGEVAWVGTEELVATRYKGVVQ